MAVHVCFMAFLAATSLGGATGMPRPMNEASLIAADPVLADVMRVHVVLATEETPQVERPIEAAKLMARISKMLVDAGIAVVGQGEEPTERLIVHVEGILVPGDGKYVYRVQTALERVVTVAGRENRRIRAEVWRVRPVMNAVAVSLAGEAISGAALVQVESFVAAREGARKAATAGMDAPAPGVRGQAGAAPGSPQAIAYPFVASKSSDVFHRADCRWAQNIAPGNLVGYKTREEAVQSGKRPCKTCKP